MAQKTVRCPVPCRAREFPGIGAVIAEQALDGVFHPVTSRTAYSTRSPQSLGLQFAYAYPAVAQRAPTLFEASALLEFIVAENYGFATCHAPLPRPSPVLSPGTLSIPK